MASKTIDLFITRTFDAPVSRVFELWAEREHRLRWWGPTAGSCRSFEQDFRVGGKWRGCFEHNNHHAWQGGEFIEIEKNKRLVFSFSWDDRSDGNGVNTIVTVQFEERDGKTVQTFHQTPFLTEEGRDSHVGGWNAFFNNAAAHLAETVESATP